MEEKKTGDHEDKYEYSEDDEAWWRLYRQEMPWEEYSSLSRGQKSSRRRRFQKAVAATREEEARASSARGVSGDLCAEGKRQAPLPGSSPPPRSPVQTLLVSSRLPVRTAA